MKSILISTNLKRIERHATRLSQTRSLFRMVLLWLITQMHGFAFGGPSFTVYGTIESKFYDTTAKPSHTIAYNYQVSVSNCLWVIQLHPISFWSAAPDAFPAATNSVCSAKYDGTNIYLLHSFEKWAESKRNSGEKIGWNVANALVVRGEVPRDPFAEGIGAVWLSYASSCYFRGRTNHDIEPMFSCTTSLITPEQIVHQRGAWRLIDMSYVPEFLTVYNDGTPLTFNSLASGHEPQKYSSPYDHGFTAAQYKVDQFTNFSGMQFPVSATFKSLAPRANGTSTNDLRVVVEHKILANQFSSETGIDNAPPSVPGETSVTEHRFFGEVVAFSYRTQGRLLTDSEVKDLPEYQIAKKVGWVTPRNFTALNEQPAGKNKRGVLLVVFISLAGIILFFFQDWLRKSRKQKQLA